MTAAANASQGGLELEVSCLGVAAGGRRGHKEVLGAATSRTTSRGRLGLPTLSKGQSRIGTT